MLVFFLSVIYYFLSAVGIAFFIRMILSFFAPDSEGAFVGIVMFLTELFMAPIRAFLERFDIMNGIPIDMSFLFGYLVAYLLRLIVAALI